MNLPPANVPDPLVALGTPEEGAALAVYAEVSRATAAGEPVALVTVIGDRGSTPRGMGAAMAVRGDGSIIGTVGGGNLEEAAKTHALRALADGRSRRLLYDFSGGHRQNLVKACMGKAEFLVQPFRPRPRLYLFGAGHIARALAPMAAGAGWHVTVADNRAGWPRPDDFGRDVVLRAGPFGETIEQLPFDGHVTWIVIVTYGHPTDEAVLRACLHRPWRYCGMIGSRAKVTQTVRSLGVDEASRRRLRNVHAPIGLDLGGRSPGEIAVSIVAELLAHRNERAGSVASLSAKRRARMEAANASGNGHNSAGRNGNGAHPDPTPAAAAPVDSAAGTPHPATEEPTC